MKDIALDEPGPDLSDRDLDLAETQLGFSISLEVREFYKRSNGGYPDRHYFSDQDYESELNRIIPIESQGQVNADNVVGIYKLTTGEGHLPIGHLPFGEDSGGNFYLIDPSDGHIWYMPMDEWHHNESAEENWKRSGRFISQSFATFLDALEQEPD